MKISLIRSMVTKYATQIDVHPQGILALWGKPTPRPESKTMLPMWAPVAYEKNERSNKNVIGIYAIVLDFDVFKEGTSLEGAKKAIFGAFGTLQYYGHTSFSHTPEKPKLRIAIPVLHPIDPKCWSAVFQWATVRATEAGLTVDRQCKDPGRAYFLPCDGSELWENKGNIADVSGIKPISPRPKPEGLRIPIRPDARYDVLPSAREEAALMLGGQVQGNSARGLLCPRCGRTSVWWPIQPTSFCGWMCSHKNSCGSKGKIKDLLGRMAR